MKKTLLASMLSGIALFSMSNVFAATTTGNFQSTASLTSKCTISAQDISLGDVNAFQSAYNYVDGSLTVLCSKSVSYTVEPLSGYLNGFAHIMAGQGGNTDGVMIVLTKTVGGTRTDWSRASTATKITGSGSGDNQTWIIGAGYNNTFQVSNYNPVFTNAGNSTAKPGNYIANITAQITY